ncbi:hypothetical protein AOQ84DRAFT_342454 [Glonium stellatum]|uniref:C2H2-type domain-containing protein n=1 Tax=Glonium stellatum TaxID=574774 RepID=A0A8E2EZ93_9PEZI|nr:hypothetical protein AOQ84DRAFT_342454 [Glonium stellatum]
MLQPQQTQSPYERTSSHSANASYGQNQARPRGVNSVSSTLAQASAGSQGHIPLASTAAYSSKRTQTIFDQQRQASPAQPQYAHNASIHGTTNLLTSVSSSAHYNEYGHRAPQSVTEPLHNASAAAASTGYNYREGNLPATAAQATSTNGVSSQYDESRTTVDPMQVYDPWPEYQRKQEALKAAKAAEDAARAEQTRKAEEMKRLEETRKAEEQKELEEERRVRESSEKSTAPEGIMRDSSTALPSSGDPVLEAEIRAMMAKMRELNGKDPALLARIWEQERKNHVASQSSIVRNDPAPQTAAHIGLNNGTKTSANRDAKPGAHQNCSTVNGGKVGPKPSQPPTAASQSKGQAQAPPKPVQAPAQPAVVSAPPVRQHGSTIWPPEKRVRLAAAASSWLNSIPQNKNKQTTGDQICRMLDSNPSYIDLCERLEGMGLKLERAAFARALLTAVPDVNSASRQSAQTQGQSSARVSAERPPLTNAQPNGAIAESTGDRTDSMSHKDSPIRSKSKNENAGYSDGKVLDRNTSQLSNVPPLSHYPPPQAPAVQSPYFRTNNPHFPDNTRIGSQTPTPIAQMTASSNIQPLRTTPKPASKEEAARKRNFSEVVDLTGFSDDDAIPPPQKKQHLDHKFSHAPPVGSIASNSMQSHASSPRFGTFPYNPVAIPQPPLMTHLPPPIPTVNDHLRSLDVVQPIDKRKALRRSTYNIKTIARDVLLATGKHPEMRPLNAHLEILKSSFDKVDNSSDLSTFRWDLVDPGEPPKGYLRNNMFENEVDDADDEEDSGDEAPAPAHPRTTVQQAVGTGGGNQTSVHTSAVLINGPVKGAPKRRGRPPRNSFPVASRPSGLGESEPSNPPASQMPNRSSGGDRSYSSRPTGPDQNPDSQSTASGSTPTVTSSAARPSGSGVGYSAFRPTHAPDGTPLPKKKGRPVGWRKHIHGSPETQARVISRSHPPQPSGLRNVTTPPNNPVVVIDSRSPSVAGEPSSTGKMRLTKEPEPHYNVYKCYWKGCAAELHNLETLRKHVHKIHGKPAVHGGYDCFWANCGKKVTAIDPRTGIQVETHKHLHFPNDVKWREHLELTHFGPLGWTLGDGPASGLSDAHDSEAYLSDSHGRQVTPQISAPISQTDSSTAYSTGQSRTVAGPAVVRRGRPSKESQEQAARDVERAMVKRRREIGPGVDRGGARLATEKRRLGFNDDEIFDEEIVDKDDD